MKKIWLALIIGIFTAACGAGGAGSGTGAAKLNIKTGGQDKTMDVKSGGVYYGNVINTSPGKPNIQTFAHTIVVANYDLDTANLATMRKPMTAADQMRVMISLTGEEATNEKSPLKTGTYDTKADKFNKVRALVVTSYVDGKDKDENFDTMSSVTKVAGTVKLTSVTDDSVAGEIDVTDGEKAIKGTFTAKLPKK